MRRIETRSPLALPPSFLARAHAPLAFWPLAVLAILVAVHFLCTEPILAVPQLEPDDFRFVARALELTPQEGLQTGLVENRWDMLPFVDLDGGVRFWRPLFPSSFALDASASDGFAENAASSASGPEAWKSRHLRFEGIQRSNVILHAICCILALVLAVRVAGTSIAALLAGIAFACFAPHSEAIWYGSGRNATLLGCTFVGAFLLHTMQLGSPRARLVRRIAAPLALAAALCSKESAVVLLPLLLLHDVLWIGARDENEPKRSVLKRARAAFADDRPLWLAYGAVLLGFFALRTLAMQGLGELQPVAPYVHLPWTAGFWPHALTNLAASLDAFALATPMAPFLMPHEFASRNSVFGAIVGALLLCLLFVVLRKSWHGRALLAFAVLTWLPTLPVYISTRYLYLPSFALAACFALALVQLARAAGTRGMLASLSLGAVLVFGCVQHARYLYHTHHYFAQLPRSAIAVSEALEGARVGGTRRFGRQRKIPRGAKVLVVDFPSDVIHAQFFEDQLRVTMNDAGLDVRVLSLLPESAKLRRPGERLVVERKGSKLELRGVSRNVLEHLATRRLFPILPLDKGQTGTTRDGSVQLEVLEGDGKSAKRVRYSLSPDFADAVVLRYVPANANPNMERLDAGYVIASGRFLVE